MAIAGKVCALWVGSTPAKVKAGTDVKFSKKGKEIDVTSWDSSGMEEFILGLQGGDCSVSGLYDPTDTNGQVVLRDASAAVPCEVRWGATTPKVAFSGLVTGFDIDSSVSDKVSFSATIKPTGAITYS